MIHEEKIQSRMPLNVTHIDGMTSSGSWQGEAARKLGLSAVTKAMQLVPCSHWSLSAVLGSGPAQKPVTCCSKDFGPSLLSLLKKKHFVKELSPAHF